MELKLGGKPQLDSEEETGDGEVGENCRQTSYLCMVKTFDQRK
jgi:hypothetical protein